MSYGRFGFYKKLILNSHEFIMKKYIPVIATILLANASSAQSGWLDDAGDLLGSDAGSMIKEATGVSTDLGNSNNSNIDLSSLASGDVSAALKQALTIGSEKVVSQLGSTDGFWGDSAIQIPLPGALNKVDTALTAIGAGDLTSDLKLRMNRAAESAVPKAKELFVTAISEMSFDDAKNILSGPDDAATSYLRRVMGPRLLAEMQPTINSSIAEAGVVKAYDAAVGEYEQLPFVSSVKTDLNSYVGDKALDGIFYYVAVEEKAIRENPAERTTDLLKSVFSAVN